MALEKGRGNKVSSKILCHVFNRRRIYEERCFSPFLWDMSGA
jgi:hypothetical protein